MFKQSFNITSSEFADDKENSNSKKEDIAEIKQRLERIEKRQLEMLTILKKLTNEDIASESHWFPILTMGDLEKVDQQVKEQKIANGNVAKNFDSIISKDIIPNLNYDGLNGKKPFKEFKYLNDALADAIKTEGSTKKTYIATIRNCFKVQKGRLAKQKFDCKIKVDNKT
ncbi:uncharacterized protein LOC116804651 [Drosophila mojavensis]|uniref:uncharacterized protein LOC116804651 n=1 Tax=Drosophila mojavensis TaxID=7230 RepID=UPI0013EEA8E2|nr:uncharacterized protein LOC116804651 [Drosophila mojavensis]